jgi:5-methylcytosine-specific restriction endonuclease McrA
MSNTLLLNADAQPVSFLPLSVISWQDAIKYMVLDKASVVEWHDDWIVRSAHWETRVPAIIMLHEYMKAKTTVRFSKQNIFLRDEWKCQYCDTHLTEKTATMDHVLPISKGGKTTFLNIVAACPMCNSSKGNDHRIVPKRKPYKPEYWELVGKRKKRPFAINHDSWKLYIDPHCK